MTDVSERLTNDAPELITRWLYLPYLWAGNYCTGTSLDVGGGELRLGHTLLGSTDIDSERSCKNTFTGDAQQLPFADSSFDTVLCFETLEHLQSPLLALSELVRVARNTVLIGSVNKHGPSFLRNDGIWKGKANPYHQSELTGKQFARLCSGLDASFYGSLLTVDNSVVMCPGLHNYALSNYAVIKKWGS